MSVFTDLGSSGTLAWANQTGVGISFTDLTETVGALVQMILATEDLKLITTEDGKLLRIY